MREYCKSTKNNSLCSLVGIVHHAALARLDAGKPKEMQRECELLRRLQLRLSPLSQIAASFVPFALAFPLCYTPRLVTTVVDGCDVSRFA